LNNSLQKKFDQLEVQRSDLQQLYSLLPQEKLNSHPDGKWSIAQIISHLIASERTSVNYLNKKILGINQAPSTGIVEAVKMIIFIISQRLPLKYKAPKVIAEKTEQFDTVEKLNAEWKKTRAELAAVLERFQDDQLQRKIFRHPVVGLINIQQALRFLSEHTRHHTPQVKNLLKLK